MLIGLAMIGASLCIATFVFEGWQSGRMVVRGAQGLRGEPDFWTIGAFLVLASLLFGGAGLIVLIKELA